MYIYNGKNLKTDAEFCVHKKVLFRMVMLKKSAFSQEKELLYGLLSIILRSQFLTIKWIFTMVKTWKKSIFSCVKKALFRMVILKKSVFSQEKELWTSKHHFWEVNFWQPNEYLQLWWKHENKAVYWCVKKRF